MCQPSATDPRLRSVDDPGITRTRALWPENQRLPAIFRRSRVPTSPASGRSLSSTRSLGDGERSRFRVLAAERCSARGLRQTRRWSQERQGGMPLGWDGAAKLVGDWPGALSTDPAGSQGTWPTFR